MLGWKDDDDEDDEDDDDDGGGGGDDDVLVLELGSCRPSHLCRSYEDLVNYKTLPNVGHLSHGLYIVNLFMKSLPPYHILLVRSPMRYPMRYHYTTSNIPYNGGEISNMLI